MTLCIPPGADWTCAYSAKELAEMRADADTAAKMERSEALAWISLHRLSGGRIGVCPITVRPCAASCSAAGTWTAAPAGSIGPFYPGSTSWSPYINAQGAWVNGCGCTSGCGCGPASAGGPAEQAAKSHFNQVNGHYQALFAQYARINRDGRMGPADRAEWQSALLAYGHLDRKPR